MHEVRGLRRLEPSLHQTFMLAGIRVACRGYGDRPPFRFHRFRRAYGLVVVAETPYGDNVEWLGDLLG